MSTTNAATSPDLTAPPIGLLSPQTLLLVLCGIFTGFFVCGDIIGNKLWEFSILGLRPEHFGLGKEGDLFVATVGIMAFPMTFVLTDIINEYFGRRLVLRLTAVAIISLLCLLPVLNAAVAAPTVSFNPEADAKTMDRAVRLAIGPSRNIIIASTIAFIIGQLLDISLFTWLRRKTKGRMLWLRAQASTVGSQLIDSFVVIFLAFVVLPTVFNDLSQPWPVGSAVQVSTTNYVIKFIISIGIIPVLYLVHFLIRLLLGRAQADFLVVQAHPPRRD